MQTATIPNTGGAAAAAHAARIRKMVGAVAYVDADAMETVLRAAEGALLVHAEQGLLAKHHRYLLQSFGLTWYCKTAEPLRLPAGYPVIEADKITVPE